MERIEDWCFLSQHWMIIQLALQSGGFIARMDVVIFFGIIITAYI